MDIQFANAWVLYLLWLVPAIATGGVLLVRSKRARLNAFISPVMQKKLAPGKSGVRAEWQIWLISIGLFLMMISAARPRWGQREETVFTRGRDLLIALDVSRSMLANDVHPDRLRRAKADLMDLIGELGGDRAGLLAFRHKAVLLCPLTTDYAYLRQSLEAVDIDSAPRGETDIGDAIVKAMDAFDNEEGSHKAIILISDGEDLTGGATEAARQAAEKGILIFTVGFGATSGSRIPNPDKRGEFYRYKGEDIVTKLNHDTLNEIAGITGGGYLPVQTAGVSGTTLGTIYRTRIRQVAEQDLEEVLQRRYIERYQVFLLPAFCLLMAGCFLSRGRLRTGKIETKPPPTLKKLAAFLVLSLSLAGISLGQTNEVTAETTNAVIEAKTEIPAGRSGARIAQTLYRKGDYEGAASAYLSAAAGSTRKSQDDFSFNAAASLFKAGKYQEAADILSGLDNRGSESGGAVSMGLGSALYMAAENVEPEKAEDMEKKSEMIREAGEAFIDAFRKADDDEDAKKNLSVALDAWEKTSEEAKLGKLNEEYGGKGPFPIIGRMLSTQREINEGLANSHTNSLPDRIRALEALAEKQEENADLWIPLKSQLMTALAQQPGQTNVQQQLAAMNQTIDLTQESMRGTAGVMKDAQLDGTQGAGLDERALYSLWKMLAPPEPIIAECLRRQTNAIASTTAAMLTPAAAREKLPEAGANQSETLFLTELFLDRFQATYPEGGGAPPAAMPAPTDGAPAQAEPALSDEDRAKILELTAQAIGRQKEASSLLASADAGKALVAEEASYKLLKEIQDLLPKQGRQQQEQQEQQEQEQEEQEQEEQEQQEQEQQEQQEESSEEQSEEQEAEEKEDATPEDVKELLEKAIEREKQHEAEKRERNRRPMLPHEKDW
ncbi:MAG: VWA domain-containing protein [Kiritimatiellia bacterium]|jgi:Ca-activated chloride channel family protein|nr:VWA domain-containing protein [Kiritimatiellia bacterium]